MKSNSQSALIVGAGIFGITTALELRHRGWRVTVVDPGPLPNPRASSTDISKVIRMDYGSDLLYVELMEESIARWRKWNGRWKSKLYHEVGFLVLSSEEMKSGSFEHESYTLLSARGWPLERLSRETVKARFPAWAESKYRDGYFNPNAGWAESGRVVVKLIDEARSVGVEVTDGVTFRQLLQSDSRITGMESTDGSAWNAEIVIVAAGSWTPILLPHLAGLMRPVAQPIVQFELEDTKLFKPPYFSCYAADISRTGWYGFPAIENGIFKIGHHGPGSVVSPDSGFQIPKDHIARCREFLRENLPGISESRIHLTRVCYYCDSWDGNFYLDHDPAHPGLFVAAGGSGHGFKFAPVLGEIAADAVEHRPNRYSHRFAWRPAGTATSEHARLAAGDRA